jgi:hypothetical protein
VQLAEDLELVVEVGLDPMQLGLGAHQRLDLVVQPGEIAALIFGHCHWPFWKDR